jgi:hypothetical protein
MPTVSHGERLGLRLSKKVEQTKRSGAQWLLIDSLDHPWHMTQWSQQSIAQKGKQLDALVRHELRDARHLLGVVISDGAALMRPDASEQTIEGPEFIALARRSDAWRIRETVIVPLRPRCGASDTPVALDFGCGVWMGGEGATSQWTCAASGVDPP